ncbi:hypothetical protein BDZ85DRAFT_257056 [Elsinoe ampelina]|uniref:Uncharacterized protein n=1 Tax=Elsinoe ampelina TaxID=302913 RepID=A0A6A6GMS6_9PEZI|nr:hypothetical protein BDZ85DRAFT_257056 [Elsinoe ampelina]
MLVPDHGSSPSTSHNLAASSPSLLSTLFTIFLCLLFLPCPSPWPCSLPLLSPLSRFHH